MRNESTYRRRGAFITRFCSCVGESRCGNWIISSEVESTTRGRSIGSSTASLVCVPRTKGRRYVDTAEGRRKERTHSRAARNCAVSETQTIHRGSFASEVDSVEAAEGACDGPDMAFCLSVSWVRTRLRANSRNCCHRPEHGRLLHTVR